jgi:hypothetical protein
MSLKHGVRKALCLVAVALILEGCAEDVSPHQLVGIWRMTKESKRLLNIESDPTFKLNTDGTLLAQQLPATAFGDLYRWQRQYSGGGTWSVPKVSRMEQFAVLVLRYETTGPGLPTGLSLQVDRDSGGLYVFAWYFEEGDERLVFRRVSDQ